MGITIHLPPELESTLRVQLGPDVEQRAKEELAVTWFRDGRLSSREVAALLGSSLFEAHAFLKARGAALPLSVSELERDLVDLNEVHGS